VSQFVPVESRLPDCGFYLSDDVLRREAPRLQRFAWG
jgi:hypothetical protein